MWIHCSKNNCNYPRSRGIYLQDLKGKRNKNLLEAKLQHLGLKIQNWIEKGQLTPVREGQPVWRSMHSLVLCPYQPSGIAQVREQYYMQPNYSSCKPAEERRGLWQCSHLWKFMPLLNIRIKRGWGGRHKKGMGVHEKIIICNNKLVTTSAMIAVYPSSK